MAKKSNGNGSGDFSKKWEKFLPTGFKESSESLSDDELKQTIVDGSRTVSQTEKDRDDDDSLKALKEDLKTMVSGYNDVIKAFEAKSRYCIFLLNQRGKI